MRHLYGTEVYADGLGGKDGIIDIPEWKTHLLRRSVEWSSGLHDAMGPYPYCPLASDCDLAGGLEHLAASGLVSAVLIPDPLMGPSQDHAAQHFDVCRPFKTHYLIKQTARNYEPTKHHRDRIRRGHRRCHVEILALKDHLPMWSDLYAELIERRDIRGVATFSAAYFDVLAGDRDLVTFAAWIDGALVGMNLWYPWEGVCTNHLLAVSAEGYANGASYALYDAAIGHFSGQVLNLGGGAGLGDGAGGLADFKRGFANDQVTSFIYGAILNKDRYRQLSPKANSTEYFPAYRAPLA
jgi:hypothetical protein